MTMDPETEDRVVMALDAVWSAAASAKAAGDLATMRAALNRVWFATHEAQNAVNDAENATRQAALAKLNLARSFA